jgi:peptide/nickel transport system substrate-binding protein
MDRQMGRREFIKLSAATGSALVISACIAPESSRPSPSASAVASPGTAGKYALGKLEGAEVILDSAAFPKTFKEAPELAALVQQGKLPKVADRIGPDPLVIKPVHETGKYGGVLRKAFIGAGDGTAFRFACGPDSLLYWDWQFKKVIPNLARSFEESADGKTLTIRLRRGMKWSDGQPLTAADIMFWYEDIYKNKEVVGAPTADLLINGKEVRIEQVDDLTVRFISPDPNYLLGSHRAISQGRARAATAASDSSRRSTTSRSCTRSTGSRLTSTR